MWDNPHPQSRERRPAPLAQSDARLLQEKNFYMRSLQLSGGRLEEQDVGMAEPKK
jgi:hypothetical protein